MVQVSDLASSAIIFKGSGRIKEPKANHFRSASVIPYLNLQLSKTTDLMKQDELSIILKSGSSNDFQSGEDGLKFFGGTNPEFAVILPNAESAVAVQHDFRATFVDNEEIPLALWIKESGNYSIQLTDIQDFNTQVYLVDKDMETITDLTADGSYHFQASATTTSVNDRFVLRAGSTTELPASVFNKITVYATNNQVYIKNLTVGDNVSIYNLAGQLVETWRATSPDTSVALPAAGVYVVKVSGAESVVAKIINK
jgi:hypothetical protein